MGYAEEQNQLSKRLNAGELRAVELDPDGMFPEEWLAVVIRHPTGVVYINQSAGVACQQRMEEGYLVMLHDTAHDPNKPPTNNKQLIGVFHQNGACMYPWYGENLPEDRIHWLHRLVRQISWWSYTNGLGHLELDLTRRDAIAEAWIPVLTPDGPGVLLYQNCD